MLQFKIVENLEFLIIVIDYFDWYFYYQLLSIDNS